MKVETAKKVVLAGVVIYVVITISQVAIGSVYFDLNKPEHFVAILKMCGLYVAGAYLVFLAFRDSPKFVTVGGLFLIAMPIYFGGMTAYRYWGLNFDFRLDYLVLSFLSYLALIATIPAYLVIKSHVRVINPSGV